MVKVNKAAEMMTKADNKALVAAVALVVSDKVEKAENTIMN